MVPASKAQLMGQPMAHNEAILRQHHPELRQLLNFKTVHPYLNRHGLITPQQEQQLMLPVYSHTDKIDMLLQELPRHGPEFMEKFIQCLRESAFEAPAHDELAGLLQRAVESQHPKREDVPYRSQRRPRTNSGGKRRHGVCLDDVATDESGYFGNTISPQAEEMLQCLDRMKVLVLNHYAPGERQLQPEEKRLSHSQQETSQSEPRPANLSSEAATEETTTCGEVSMRRHGSVRSMCSSGYGSMVLRGSLLEPLSEEDFPLEQQNEISQPSSSPQSCSSQDPQQAD